MTTHKNLLPRVAAFENLVRAFGEASRGKRDQPDVQRFEFALEERLWEITRELEAERYQWGGYRAFWIFDPKRRLIRAAPFRDRVVHHALYRVLAPIVERGYVTDSYACRVGRGSLAAVRRYEEYVRRQGGGRGYVLKADVKQYFPSVNHAVLRGLLRRKIGDARVLRLLDRLIASGDEGGGTGMPIGNLTSQLFANLYLDPLDHFVKEVLRRRFYIRYMDDFVVLAEEKAELWEILGTVGCRGPDSPPRVVAPLRVGHPPTHPGPDPRAAGAGGPAGPGSGMVTGGGRPRALRRPSGREDDRDSITRAECSMDTTRVKALTDEILGLPEPERAELAEAVLPALLTTTAGLAGVDQAVEELSEAELVALVERARRRGRDVTDAAVAAVIAEVLRAVRAARRP